MNVRQNLTLTNFNAMTNKINRYIVIHYVGAVSSAWANSLYFKSIDRGASANWFVDDIEAVQVVKDSDRSWHCGDWLKSGNGGRYYGKCTNSNSIGIEMCCYWNNGKLDISEKTIANTIELVKELMVKYNIPAENVIRHYDVTNKICPAPFVEDESRWIEFKARLGQSIPTTQTQPTTIDYTGTITYQAYDGKWEKEVNKCDNTPEGYAGDSIHFISGVRAKPQYGEIIIEAHELNGNWLGAISSKDYITNDINNGNSYAGIYGKPMDAIRIKSTRGYVDYRTLIKNNDGALVWLEWVRGFGDNPDEYAGIFGKPIYGLQMK